MAGVVVGGSSFGDLSARLERERGLFSPIEVHPRMIEWMASERALLESHLPQNHRKLLLSLQDLSSEENRELVNPTIFADDPAKKELSGSSRRMYRQLRETPPRVPVYVVPSIREALRVERSQAVGIEGSASDVDLEARVFHPSSHGKLMLLWSMIGVIHDLRQPIMGFLREDRPGGLMYSVEPKTSSLKEHVLRLGRMGGAVEEKIGGDLAGLVLRAAGQHIRPRGACNADNICVRSGGELYFRGTVFQATDSPQDSMSFMLSRLSPSSLGALAQDGVFTEAMQRVFLDRINQAGLLDLRVFDEMRRSAGQYYALIPPMFKTYGESMRKSDLPPPRQEG
jgi:hypothetical protein